MLSDLPPEILAEIVSNVPTAQCLRNLSLTCRTLRNFVEAEGWKAFTLSRFPSLIQTPAPWKDAAHALTTLSRNWDRRAFVARRLAPHSWIHSLPGGRIKETWNKRPGQTMGYQPVIDSYIESTGEGWNCNREIVAWGAGAELVIKVVRRGDDVLKEYRRDSRLLSADERARYYEGNPTSFSWLTYHEPDLAEGRDDITSVNILKPDQRHASNGGEEIIVGRASGKLSLLRDLTTQRTRCKVTNFDTQPKPIRSSALSNQATPLLAVAVSNVVALYPTTGEPDELIDPLSEAQCAPSGSRNGNPRAVHFLSNDRVVAGCTISANLVKVYGIQPDGLTSEPIRQFAYDDEGSGLSSCHVLARLPESSVASSDAGNVFFSGSSDSAIRLHDMRSPSNTVAQFNDHVDYSPVFSLCTIGRERLVAGGARHDLVKIFDLRMPGGRAYSYLDTLGHDANRTPSTGWNVFSGGGRTATRGHLDSPVYSLSSPSASSPSLYVGLENTVLHFNFSAMLDQHPDPLFKHAVVRSSPPKPHRGGSRPAASRPLHVKRTWRPDRPGEQVVDLAMYEHVEERRGVGMLCVQRSVAPVGKGAEMLQGYDERWVASSRLG